MRVVVRLLVIGWILIGFHTVYDDAQRPTCAIVLKSDRTGKIVEIEVPCRSLEED